jgi:hypothetical protein
MGVLRDKTGQDSALGQIAKRLRADGHGITQQPLPERWVDLIHHLNESERLLRLQAETEQQRRPKH